jgi:hypothetical protein
MATGLGAFTEGFGAGYTGVQKSRQRRRINRALDMEIAEMDLKRKGALEETNYQRELAGLDPLEGYGGDLKPTWGEKLGGWAKQQAGKVGSAVGGAMGFGGQQQQGIPTDTAAAPAAQFQDAYQAPPQQQPTNRFGPDFRQQPQQIVAAEGGAVRHMVKKYYGGGSVNRSMQPTPLANGGRALPANRSVPGRTTGQIPGGAVMFADGGNYSSGLHAIPQPLRNGGAATFPINTRNQSRTAIPLQDGGPLTEDEKALRRAKQLREQRARTAARADAPRAPQGPIEDVAKQQRGQAPAKPAAETKPQTRTSRVTGREVPAKETKPRTTKRLADLAKKGTKGGAVAAAIPFYAAERALETGAPGLGVAAHGVASLARGQDMADVTGEAGLTPTSEYRERLGMTDPSENEAVRFAGDFLARGLGTLQDLGDKLTLGYGAKISDAIVRKLSGIEDDDDKAAAVREMVPAQPDAQAPPDQAIDTAPGQTAAAPGQTAAVEEDPEIDMAGPEMVGVMPEDMPSHSVKDWEAERHRAAAFAITQGRDPNDAMLAIDQQQQRGFLRYLNQAQRLLVAGDGQSAARAMYAAYSYFPNGSDVRFGITKGADGMPILMGMGQDEETGEPINEGKTMALTPETIAVMAENASDPSAWRVWTKDWRDTEQQIREYEEVTKKQAQADVTYKERAGRAAETRAAADVITAQRGGSPLKESDYRGSATAINELIALDRRVNPDDFNALADLSMRVKRNHPRQDNMTIGRMVIDAYAQGLGPDEILDEMDRAFSQ